MPNTYDSEKEKIEILAQYRDLLDHTYRNLNDENKKLIRKAFDIALDAHKDQRRKSGEPYIYHPIAVAKIVADEMGLGTTSIVCALLHDVIEDSDYTYEDIEKIFGGRIAKIVNGLTKISVMNNQNISVQSENYRKLLLTLSEDFRVILVKLADRLHNMRTLGSMRPDKQQKIAAETVYIYAPLAHRLGFYNIKTELEDLSFKYSNPEMYHELEAKLYQEGEDRQEYLREFMDTVSSELKKHHLEFVIKGRTKAISSIYRKMQNQQVGFEEVFDNYAIRIIYKVEDPRTEKFLAWQIYSIVNELYQSSASRMRDWINHPRASGYESLHGTFLGPDNRWVEVQIRSERMDEVAEKGVAAHYKYKENFRKNLEDTNFEAWVTQIREVLESPDVNDVSEILDGIKLNLYTSEVHVFTPKGDVIRLPKGATALDFAFALHTDLGMRCLGAKVHGKLVPLSYKLESGDQVEILSSNQQRPNQDWLNIVVTSKAKSKIRHYLNNQKNAFSVEGKDIFLRKLNNAKLKPTDEEISQLVKHFGLLNSQELFLQFYYGKLDTSDLKKYAESKSVLQNLWKKIRHPAKLKKEVTTESRDGLNLIVFGRDEQKLDYTYAKCCTVVPGDKIFGYISTERGIIVHNHFCSNAIDMRANFDNRILTAKWVNDQKFNSQVRIEIEGIDQQGLVSAVTQVISEVMNLNMKSISIDAHDGIFIGTIVLEVLNKKQLDQVMSDLRKVSGVIKVKRI